MKSFFILAILFILSGCGVNEGVTRNYIISHSEVENYPLLSEEPSE